MRSFITALAMVAVATTSFAIGRSTSGTVAKPVVAESAATIDTARLHATIGELPEMSVDTPY